MSKESFSRRLYDAFVLTTGCAGAVVGAFVILFIFGYVLVYGMIPYLGPLVGITFATVVTWYGFNCKPVQMALSLIVLCQSFILADGVDNGLAILLGFIGLSLWLTSPVKFQEIFGNTQ